MAHFREHVLAASLKLETRYRFLCFLELFPRARARGLIEAASARCPSRADSHFREHVLAASLKPAARFRCPAGRSRFPRARARGLIEARLQTSRSRPFW